MARSREKGRYARVSRQRPRVLTRALRWLAGLTLSVVLMAIVWLAYFAFTPLSIPPGARELQVGPGATLHRIGSRLVASGVLGERLSFVTLGRLQGKSGSVKAGLYMLPERISPSELIDKLSRGDVLLSEITFIEGWTFAQMRAALDASPDVRHDTTGLGEAELLRLLKAPETKAEGLFFPDTYRFNTAASDVQILARAYETMRERLRLAWERRAPDLPYATPYEALTMASIVEKETGRPEDRNMIAAVFINRLKLGMRLQTDPTVIYGMGAAFDGNLRKRDLLSDGPFNTYTRAGLPPTPIALPGQASLDAAVDPAESKALYFVSRGDGTSHFSGSLEEHNRAVQRYQLRK